MPVAIDLTEKHLPAAVNRRYFFGFCALVVFSVVIWAFVDPPGWDVGIYYKAIQSLAAGHDPYADAMAIQREFHAQMALHPGASPPYSYVYSPITLPLLRLIGHLPVWFSAALYGIVYILAVLVQLRVTLSAATAKERPYLLYFAAVAPFFPGLIATGIIQSGNVAYILYAAILLAALVGWRRGKWSWFYLAVLLASCVKAPFLSLAVIPFLSARRQWIPTALTCVAGIALFAVQPYIWPELFRHYLQAVELQFSFNRDFGSSPAGLFCGVLYDHGVPYSPGGLIFFLCYAIPVAGTLFYLSRLYLRGGFPLGQWMPVMLVGIILLNPRIQEYDVAPLAIPLALIGWRFLTGVMSSRRAVLIFSIFFVVTNAFGLYKWSLWKLSEGPLLVLFFVAGSWTLSRCAPAVHDEQPSLAGGAQS